MQVVETMALTLIITGMHRSGTSLTASFIKTIGVDVGNDFFPADEHNLKGYFEDVDFLEFQRSVLQDCCRRREGGNPDWGWTESEYLDRGKFDRYTKIAKELIQLRDRQLPVWGWKDPRTSLMLDFWDNLLPEAKYLFVYRFPWDVADSMQRLKAGIFRENPDYAYRIWAFYNRHLLDFYQQNSDRCLLFNVNAWIKNPDRLSELLQDKLGLEVLGNCDRGEFEKLYDERLFKSLDWHDRSIHFLHYTSPEYFALLAELDRFADIKSEFDLAAIADAFPKSKSSAVIPEVWDLRTKEPPENIISNRVAIVPQKMKTINQYDRSEIVVSVVIPCYNQGEYILEAISSVEACQERIYEILIVNDCSTENLTIKVLNYLRDNGYLVIDHQSNQGLAEARNTGVMKARGRYILPLDSDNKIRPEYLTKAIEILDKYPEIGIVYGNPEYFGERTGVWEVPEFNINKIAARNYIDACAIYRKQVWQECGGYDPKIPDKLGYEDWDFWLGAAENGWQFYHVNEVLFDYRVRGDSMVSACRIPENHARLVHYISSKHLGIYTTNFASILAEKDAALLIEASRYERMEMELQKTQVAFAESQEQLERIQSAWEESQVEIQRIQTAWEEAQKEVQQIQTGWEEAQSELQIAHTVGEKTQTELRRIQTAWDDSQAEIQRVQTAWDEARMQLQVTHTAWKEAEAEAQRINAAWKEAQQRSQTEIQQIQTAWEQAQQQVQLTQAEWEKTQQQLQLTQAEWQQAQQEVQSIYAAWQQAQQQVQLTHGEWERSQQQMQSIQAAWEQAQQQVQQVYSVWGQAQQQMQAEREQSQSQLQQMQSEWEKKQQEFQQVQVELERARSLIQEMQNSKFWKFKNTFFKFKQAIGLANKD